MTKPSIFSLKGFLLEALKQTGFYISCALIASEITDRKLRSFYVKHLPNLAYQIQEQRRDNDTNRNIYYALNAKVERLKNGNLDLFKQVNSDISQLKSRINIENLEDEPLPGSYNRPSFDTESVKSNESFRSATSSRPWRSSRSSSGAPSPSTGRLRLLNP